MPDHKTHREFSRLFDLDSSKVDRIMDEPYKYLGRKHRILNHDTAFICSIALDDGLEEGIKAWLHLVLDEDKSLEGCFKCISVRYAVKSLRTRGL